MDNLPDFLKQFNIPTSVFEATGLKWNMLLKIKADYESYIQELSPPANYLIESFHSVKSIHSVRFRLKSPSHLVEKIIRKKVEEPERVIDLANYRNEITDLIGIRALHLFKEDWLSIHHFITGTWNLHEEPIAYYRSGDSPEFVEIFKKYGCKVKEHPHGYRSVHYLVKTNPNKNTYISEVQVRTIFEEGWSEIDHKIRYPYDRDNKLLSQFLVMFNRLSGNADEMGSYIQYLKRELDNKEKEYKEAVEKKIEIIEDLKKKIKELELKPKVAQQWEFELNEILKLPTLNINNFELKMPDYVNIQMPDITNINIPDFSDIKIPDYASIKLPDYSQIKLPDYLNSVSPTKLTQIEKKSENNPDISKKKENKKDK